MLKENIKAFRKAKGLSQEALAAKLHVVRQTVSKWEQGLSAPDGDMLLHLADILETSVGALIGETAEPLAADELHILSGKLKSMEQNTAFQKEKRQKWLHCGFVSLCMLTAVVLIVCAVGDSVYLGRDDSKIENAVLGVVFHSLEWLFVRAAPLLLGVGLLGVFLTRKRISE